MVNALLSNNRLGWKCDTVTKVLTRYNQVHITTVKRFMAQGPSTDKPKFGHQINKCHETQYNDTQHNDSMTLSLSDSAS